jgi:hypothetical protein
VPDRLGHEKIEMTLRHHAHAMPDMQRRAVEAVMELFRQETLADVKSSTNDP